MWFEKEREKGERPDLIRVDDSSLGNVDNGKKMISG